MSTAWFLRSVELVVINYHTTVHIIMVAHTCDPLDPVSHRSFQIWPTHDQLLTHMLKMSFKSNAKSHGKFLEKCHRFLHSWNHSYEWNLWTLHFKTAWSVKLVLYQWWFSVFLRPKLHLLIKCQCLFLKNRWSIKNLGHIQII